MAKLFFKRYLSIEIQELDAFWAKNDILGTVDIQVTLTDLGESKYEVRIDKSESNMEGLSFGFDIKVNNETDVLSLEIAINTGPVQYEETVVKKAEGTISASIGTGSENTNSNGTTSGDKTSPTTTSTSGKLTGNKSVSGGLTLSKTTTLYKKWTAAGASSIFTFSYQIENGEDDKITVKRLYAPPKMVIKGAESALSTSTHLKQHDNYIIANFFTPGISNNKIEPKITINNLPEVKKEEND